MGERRAGLNRVGFRRLGGTAAAGGTGAVGWVNDVASRMTTILGLSPSAVAVFGDDFVGPVSGTAGARSFGERWLTTVGSGAWIDRVTSTGSAFTGGVAVIQQTSTAWTTNQLVANCAGITRASSALSWGVACRVNRFLAPAATAFNAAYFGVTGASTGIVAGTDESIDPTNLWISSTSFGQVVSSYPFANLNGVFRELMILVAPQGGNSFASLYVDSNFIVQIRADIDTYVPIIYANKGIYVWDGVCMVVPSAVE